MTAHLRYVSILFNIPSLALIVFGGEKPHLGFDRFMKNCHLCAFSHRMNALIIESIVHYR